MWVSISCDGMDASTQRYGDIVAMVSSGPKVSRFDLPGLNLPLNLTPH
jgi:hypothetical protein